MRRFRTLVPVTLAAGAAAACAVTHEDTPEPLGVAAAAGKGQAACTTADLTNSNGYVIAGARVHVILWGFQKFGDVANETNAVRRAFGTSSAPGAGIQNTHFWQGSAMQFTDHDLVPSYLGRLNVDPMYGATVDFTFDDTGLTGTSCSGVSEAQIQNEVTHVNTHAVYPNGYRNADDLVIVALPNCTANNNGPGKHYFDASHGWAWGYVPYHPTDPQNFVKTISHEVIEAATNPYSLQVVGGTSYLPPVPGKNGWEQPGSSCEIADLCEREEFGVQTQSLATGAAQTLTQTLWSNEIHDCVFSRAELAAVVGLGTDRRVYVQRVVANTTGTGGVTAYPFQLVPSPAGASTFVGKPSVTSWAVNEVSLAVLDSNGRIWKAQSNNGAVSFAWDTLLPTPTVNGASYYFSTADLGASIPDTVSTGAGNLQIYAWAFSSGGGIAPPAHLVRNGFDWGNGWTGWQEIHVPAYPASRISAASPMATQTTQYGSDIAVGLAYVDSTGLLWIGTPGGTSTPPSWQSYRLGFGATPRAVELAAYNPRRWDALVLDTTGALWDCHVPTGGQALMSCDATGTAPSGGFTGWPGMASMGDGRLLMVGQVGGAGADAAFLRFVNGTQATAWNGKDSNDNRNGTLVAGLDVIAF